MSKKMQYISNHFIQKTPMRRQFQVINICIDFQYESIITTPDGLLIYIALMDLR